MMSRLLAIFLTFSAAGVHAQTATPMNLMGAWVVNPFIYKGTGGCRYEQTIAIRKRVAPNRYTGQSISQYTCNGVRHAGRSRAIVITVTGRQVRIDAPGPGWSPEILRYVSPYLMEGRDQIGNKMIYRRPKGPPVS